MSNTALGLGDIVAERYRIDGLLGQGGMGSVYRAVQLSMGRSVALKLLATEQAATRDQVERFEREAQALARLQHPSTVRLFDFGSVEPGRPFIVMELLGGADLEEDLAHNGPMRWDQALRVCRQVLGSLGEAHGLGIIHRDVKPANVYLCAGGPWPSVKLLDFGIAGCVELASTRKLTATGTVLGSAPYMSPEQAQGQPVGPGADLYALGVVLFEMLTGQTPFAGRGFTAQLVAKVLEPAPRLLDICPTLSVPPELCELVGQLLERDAGRRPACAQALSERLSALLDEHAVPGCDSPELERALPSRERRVLPPKTEPMLVPRTITDGWVPPSAPSTIAPSTFSPPTPAPTVPRRRRSGRTAVLALSLATTALAVAWWGRELYEPAAGARDDGAALLSPAAPSPGPARAASEPAGPIPVQVASVATSALGEELGDAIAEAPDAGAANAPPRDTPVEPPSVAERPPAAVGSRPPRQTAEAPASLSEGPKTAKSAAKRSGARRAGRPPASPTPPAAVLGGASSAGPRGEVTVREPQTSAESSGLEPSPLGAPSSGDGAGASAPSSGVLTESPPAAALPSAAAPAGAVPSAGPPSGLETSPGWPAPREALPVPERPSPAPRVEPQPRYTVPAPTYTPPAPTYTPTPEPIPSRSARWLLRRYPTVASASEAARAGEITPSERNLIVAELRRSRQHERGRAIRQYRDGYIDRGELRTRLREIDRRHEGAFEQSPRAGIHIWP